MARPRILLADAHSEMRDMVVHLLEPEFEMLEPVANGHALLEKASELKPDVCLLAISMPIINGIEAAAQLISTDSKARIIFLTIDGDLDFVDAALKTGALGYVIKPRIVSDLKTAVKEVLAGRVYLSPRLRSRTGIRGSLRNGDSPR